MTALTGSRASPETIPWPSVAAESLPWLSVDEMRSIDSIMVEELGITLTQMMENAGRNLAVLARHLLGGTAVGRSVTVLAGPGGNGGGGLAAARHLLGAGASVHVVLSSPPERLAPTTRDQLAILNSLSTDVRIGATGRLPASDLVLDCLLGYSQSGPPHGHAARLIDEAAAVRVLSLDVPSGLELATGVLHAAHVSAEATMTLAAPKTGLGGPTGELYLADISVPKLAFARIGREYVSPFAQAPLVRIV